jgi:hypothetical protein
MATRIAIHYGDAEYAISGREVPDVVAEIEAGVASAEPRWLEVAIGQGRATDARLLLGPGIPIAVWEVNTDGPDTPREPDPSQTRAS